LVAEAEIRSCMSREAALAFYRSNSTKGCVTRGNERITRVSAHEEPLMLYRDPPAWHVLDDYSKNLKSSTEKKPQRDVATPNQAVGKRHIQALTEVINSKRIRVSVPSPVMSSFSVQQATSKNPFRRKQPSANASDPMSHASARLERNHPLLCHQKEKRRLG
jgi:hypothetical protein